MDPTGYGICTPGLTSRIGSRPCTTCIVDEEAISAVPANRPNPTTSPSSTSAATPGSQRWVSKHSQSWMSGRHSTSDIHTFLLAHPTQRAAASSLAGGNRESRPSLHSTSGACGFVIKAHMKKKLALV